MELINLPHEVALFPIRGCILPPGQHLPLNVFEPRYLNMIDDAMSEDRLIAMVQSNETGTSSLPGLEAIGTLGQIKSHEETDDGRYLIVLEGVIRFNLVEELDRLKPYRIARVDYDQFEHDLAPDPLADTQFRSQFLSSLRRFFDLTGFETDWDSLDKAPLSVIVDKVAMMAPFDPDTKQTLLIAATPQKRAEQLLAFINAVIDSQQSSDPAEG